MAGKNHHYLWRMMQRGFGAKRGGDHHVWVYRKGSKPNQKGTGNFGVAKYYYGPEGSDADKSITDFENSVQGAIQDARRVQDGVELDRAFVAPLVAHLEVRSLFLRAEMSNMVERMFCEITSHFGSRERIQAMLKGYLKDNPNMVDERLAKELVSEDQREDAKRILDIYIDNLSFDALASFFEVGLNELFAIAQRAPDEIKKAHNAAIVALKEDSPRVRLFDEFTYSVYRPNDSHFILPDTNLAMVGRHRVSPFSQPKDDLHSIIIPISSEVAIVGQRNAHERMSIVAANRLLAGCAYEAFIAKENDPKLARLTGRIGKFARLISDRELRDKLVFENLFSF